MGREKAESRKDILSTVVVVLKFYTILFAQKERKESPLS